MKKRRLIIILLSILLFLLLGIAADIWISSNWLTVREYHYPAEQTDIGQMDTGRQVKMAVLSDLHGHEFGRGNQKLVQKTAEQEPDIILLDGDILNEDSEDAEVPCEAIKALCKIAPVYYALGNHEEAYMENGHPELISELEAAGAVVLDKEYVDLDINGIALRLGGMYDYAFGLNGKDEAAAAPQDTKDFMEDYQNTERVKIMMAHRPDSFVFGDASSYWNVDLVISGHDHGGQIVLPILGGLYGGDQGWFPEYVHGMYQKDQMQIFITSGLGSNKQILPRFNNPPEIAIVTIREKK